MYSGYRIAIDETHFLGFDDSSSSHTDNWKNNFLVLGEGPTYGINGSFDSPDKKFSINFSKTNTIFCLSLHYNDDNSYLFVNRKEIFKFKPDNKYVNFPIQFFLERKSNGFGTTNSRELSLKGNVYDFSVDNQAIDKSDILNIDKYIMVKNNIKQNNVKLIKKMYVRLLTSIVSASMCH